MNKVEVLDAETKDLDLNQVSVFISSMSFCKLFLPYFLTCIGNKHVVLVISEGVG